MKSRLLQHHQQRSLPPSSFSSSYPCSSGGGGLVLWSTPKRGEGRGDEDDAMDSMRRLLEASWNVETMGTIPTTPEAAVDAAASCVEMARQPADGGKAVVPLFYVDLLLPQYDIRQGTRFYDEVKAVEFCIGLAKRLSSSENNAKKNTLILVNDDATLQTVQRVLTAREDNNNKNKAATQVEDDDDNDDGDVEFYDDFADFGLVGETTPDVVSFREKLISTWDTTSSTTSNTPQQPDPATAATPPEPLQQQEPPVPSPIKEKVVAVEEKKYRLASLLGDPSTLPKGSDMLSAVVQRVANNAQPNTDEETIIILSATSREEMIAVRSLVAKYSDSSGSNQQSKTILLVNCQFDAPPRELIAAQTVYSIQPLIARPRGGDAAAGAGGAKNNPPPPSPKIVVMRRYPRDWEIFVDAGSNSGFELAATIPASQVPKKGPSMELIANCVKRYLQSRLT